MSTALASRLSEAARQELVLSCRNLAASLGNRAARLAGLDSDDLCAEALFALNRCSYDFDPDRGCKFVTLAHVAIRHHLKNVIKRERVAAGRCVNLSSLEGSPHMAIGAGGTEPAAPEVYRPEPDEPERLRPALDALTERERYIVLAIVGDGRRGRQVGRDLGISAQRVWVLLDRALGKIGPLVGEPDLQQRWRERRAKRPDDGQREGRRAEARPAVGGNGRGATARA